VTWGIHGNYLEVKMRNGKTYYVPTAAYSQNADAKIHAAMQDAVSASEALHKGKDNGDGTVTYEHNGITQTYRKQDLQEVIIASLNQAGKESVLSLGISKPADNIVKPEESEQAY